MLVFIQKFSKYLRNLSEAQPHIEGLEVWHHFSIINVVLRPSSQVIFYSFFFINLLP